MDKAAYLIIRLTMGASMLGHGLVRLPKLTAFSHWMVETFKPAMLPQAMVIPFSYALPVVEFGVGLCLLTGLFVRQTLITGAVSIMLLVIGSCLIENWDAIPSQLIHTAFFALLMQYRSADTYTVDRLLARKTIREHP